MEEGNVLKIGLITYSNTKNYGGILQAYALYQVLDNFGHDVEFINYIPTRCNIDDKKVCVQNYTSKSKLWGMNAITKGIWGIFFYPNYKKGYLKFTQFIEKDCKQTKKYYNSQQLENDPPCEDLFITGSDQVWNSQFLYSDRIDKPYYLNFTDKYKISYASSFGASSIPQSQQEDVKELLSKYKAISVREESGQKILEDLGIQSDVTVDPTLLCDKNIWEKSANETVEYKNYILLYQIKYNDQTLQTAQEFAEKTGKKLVIVSLNSKDKFSKMKNLIILPSVNMWLSLIKNADIVITDSFHACIFSIHFKTKFIVNSGARKGMSTRIDNLLKMVDLKQRDVEDFTTVNVLSVFNKEIDWEKTVNLINIQKEKSENWLKNNLAKCESEKSI